MCALVESVEAVLDRVEIAPSELGQVVFEVAAYKRLDDIGDSLDVVRCGDFLDLVEERVPVGLACGEVLKSGRSSSRSRSERSFRESWKSRRKKMLAMRAAVLIFLGVATFLTPFTMDDQLGSRASMSSNEMGTASAGTMRRAAINAVEICTIVSK